MSIVTETLDLFRQIELDPSNFNRCAEKIYSLNQGIPYKVALVYKNSTRVPFDDLLQEASIGLLKAIGYTSDPKLAYDPKTIYRPSLGVPFSSYAYPKCRSEILHYNRDKRSVVKIPRSAQEKTDHVRRIAREINKDLDPHQHLSEPEVAMIEFGWTADEWRIAISATKGNNTGSLDAGESEYPLAHHTTPLENLTLADEQSQKVDLISTAIALMPEGARDWAMLHYCNGMDFKAIGKLYNVSAAKVKRQVEDGLKVVAA